jgi:phosphoribosylformylglycinamidine cyclo-ligase
VGVVDEAKVVDGAAIRPGDAIIGLASQGLHSNGYSLARRVLLDELHLGIHDTVAGLSTSLGEELLRPTRIYVKTILALLRTFTIKGMAHITGGGIAGNVIRILPPGSKAVIVKERWQIPPIFHLIAERGNIPDEERWKTFNNGVGFVLVVAAADAAAIVQAIEKLGNKAFIIGEVVAGEGVELV